MPDAKPLVWQSLNFIFRIIFWICQYVLPSHMVLDSIRGRVMSKSETPPAAARILLAGYFSYLFFSKIDIPVGRVIFNSFLPCPSMMTWLCLVCLVLVHISNRLPLHKLRSGQGSASINLLSSPLTTIWSKVPFLYLKI